MTRTKVLVRSVAVALLLGVVASVVALAATRDQTTSGRPEARATMASNEKVKVAIAAGKLLFVGASYTVGLGATTSEHGYAPVLAGNLDRRFTVAAASGTGFLNPGRYHQGTYAERIDQLPSDVDPRIVVIQGGRNDVGYPQVDLQAAARDTIRLAQQRFVHAQVVVMGPIPAAVPVSPALSQVRDIVRAAARQTGAGFVDPIAQSWITAQNEKKYAGPVPAHPNDAGYRYIASRLLADLPAALEESQPPVDPETEAPRQPASPTAPVPALGGATPAGPGGIAAAPSAGAGETDEPGAATSPAPDAGGGAAPSASPSLSPSAGDGSA